MAKNPKNFLPGPVYGYGLFEVWWSTENGMSFPVLFQNETIKFIDRHKAKAFALDLADENRESGAPTKFFKVVGAAHYGG